jgi:hypothetical protein
MKTTRSRMTFAALLTACSALAGSVHAGLPGPQVTLDDALLERFAKVAAREAVEANHAKLTGNVAIKHKDSESIVMEIPVEKLGARLTMKVRFRVLCYEGGEITLRPEGVSSTADNVLASLAEGFVPSVIRKAKASFEKDLRSRVFATNDLGDRCPDINVLTDGSFYFNWDEGYDCTAGQTRHLACPGTFVGQGRDLVCDNGHWAVQSFACQEPTPSPGAGSPIGGGGGGHDQF